MDEELNHGNLTNITLLSNSRYKALLLKDDIDEWGQDLYHYLATSFLLLTLSNEDDVFDVFSGISRLELDIGEF